MDIDKMRDRILEVSDPTNPYSRADFDKEFDIQAIKAVVADPDMYKLNFGFANKSNNPDPEYATNGSSGFDLRAFVPERLTIKSGDYKLIPTGLYFDIPDNMELTVRSRSGLAYKHGICVLNGIGTIDSDYTGEVGVLLINHGKEDFIINNGDRIAQCVLSSVFNKNLIKLIKQDEIDKTTNRGSGGYGHTGSK